MVALITVVFWPFSRHFKPFIATIFSAQALPSQNHHAHDISRDVAGGAVAGILSEVASVTVSLLLVAYVEGADMAKANSRRS